MKNKFTAFLVLFVLTLFSTNPSSAKIHVEPYLGYSFTFLSSEPIKQHQQTTELIQTAQEGEYFSGISPGIRLGYSSLGLAVGVDASFGWWNSVYSSEDSKTIIPTLPGVFASYKLPLFFRAYAVLIPKAYVQIKSPEDILNTTCNGTRGLKLGVSYLSLPFVSVNFEYLPLYIRGEGCNKSWSHTASAYANFTF